MEEAEKQKSDLLVWWKRKYNYSSNDGRYLTVTPSQLYADRLEEMLANTDGSIAADNMMLKAQEKALQKHLDEKKKKETGIWISENKQEI